MSADRYLKVVLTVIAIELGYIALTQTATPVRAQAEPAPVVITGVDLRDRSHYLPVAVLGQPRERAPQLAKTFAPVDAALRNEPIRVSTGLVEVRTVAPVKVEADRPLNVTAERPLKVDVIPSPGARQPGE